MYSDKVKDATIIPEAGVQQKVTLEDVKFEDSRLTFTFKQEDGGLVTHSEFSPNSTWDVEVQQTDTSRRVKHIANTCAIEYTIEETDSFDEFAQQIINQFPKIEGTFNVLFIYNKKGFVCLPKYPPFMERTNEDGTVNLKISKYNKGRLAKPEPDPEPESEKQDDNLPF